MADWAYNLVFGILWAQDYKTTSTVWKLNDAESFVQELLCSRVVHHLLFIQEINADVCERLRKTIAFTKMAPRWSRQWTHMHTSFKPSAIKDVRTLQNWVRILASVAAVKYENPINYTKMGKYYQEKFHCESWDREQDSHVCTPRLCPFGYCRLDWRGHWICGRSFHRLLISSWKVTSISASLE